MKKVSIFALHLGYGGIERCIASLANILVEKYDVEILSTYRVLDEPAFTINKKVKIKYLIEEVKPNKEEWKSALKNKKIFSLVKESIKSVYCLLLRRRRTIRAIKRTDADIVISTRDLFHLWVSRHAPKRCKKVAWEHNHHHGNEEYAKKIVKSCKNIDELVLVSDSLRNYYKKAMKKTRYKCHCSYIPNILEEIPKNISPLTETRLISVGRFSREKGFPDLIDTFAMAYEENPNLRLDLVGDGAQKNMIVDKIYEKKLENIITVHGFLKRKEINKLLEKASLYVMTSFTESFGIVLIEAMSYGVPCIAFSSAEGACDLIKDGENGFLIRDRNTVKMKDKIITVMEDFKLRRTLGDNARMMSKNYTKENVKEQWFKLLK